MVIKVGTDILKSSRFLKSFKVGGEAFLKRIFTPQEIRQNSPDQLASIFCLKEAVLKAIELPVGSLNLISTNRKENGKVEVSFLDENLAKNIQSLDSSISHDAGLIVATVVVVLN